MDEPEFELSTLEDEYNQAMESISMRSPEAWVHLCNAANHGYGKAQAELAFWHRIDIQLPDESWEFRADLYRDNRIAFMWYTLAEYNGDLNSRDDKEYIASRLTFDEMTEAIKIVKNWQPGQCPTPPIP